MSEYQYYEWQTLDRLLTPEEQAAVNKLSSHIDVTSTRAVVSYSSIQVLADQALSQTQEVMAGLKRVLADRFDIEHTTIQFECEVAGRGRWCV